MNALEPRRVVTIVFDPALRSLLNDFVSSREYAVDSAKDGLDAFHKLAKQYFHLIITDMQMPGLGGVELVPRLKRIQPWARVVVIPTKKIRRNERQILQSAADICIEKPFKLSQLETAIQGMFPPTGERPSPKESEWSQGRLSWQHI